MKGIINSDLKLLRIFQYLMSKLDISKMITIFTNQEPNKLIRKYPSALKTEKISFTFCIYLLRPKKKLKEHTNKFFFTFFQQKKKYF